jgi:hypothetical protein
MDNPGATWAVILSNPELRDGQIREAAQSRRRDRAVSGTSTLRRWFGFVVRTLAFHPQRPISQDSSSVCASRSSGSAAMVIRSLREPNGSLDVHRG